MKSIKTATIFKTEIDPQDSAQRKRYVKQLSRVEDQSSLKVKSNSMDHSGT